MTDEEIQKLLEEYFNLKPLIMDEDATTGEDLVRFGELCNILFEKEKVLQDVHVVAVVIPRNIYEAHTEIEDTLNSLSEELSGFNVDVKEYVDVTLTPEWEKKLFGEE